MKFKLTPKRRKTLVEAVIVTTIVIALAIFCFWAAFTMVTDPFEVVMIIAVSLIVGLFLLWEEWAWEIKK